jgi:hypothetical protein
MKSPRSVFVAVVALFALGASSASAALPELKPAPTEAQPVTFTATTSAPTKMYQSNGQIMECAGTASISGEFINPKAIRNTVVTFTHCKLASYKCGNAEPETIKSAPLSGTLGYVNKAKQEVGLMFGAEFKHKPLEKPPIWAAAVFCLAGGTGQKADLVGELISSITPVNRQVKVGEHFSLVNQGSFSGIQEITKFEGGVENQQLSWSTGVTTAVKATFALGPLKKQGVEIEAELAA